MMNGTMSLDQKPNRDDEGVCLEGLYSPASTVAIEIPRRNNTPGLGRKSL